VESGLKSRWPKNLSVRKLFVRGSLTEHDIKCLSSIQGELQLEFYHVAPENMYQLVERMGQFVKSLEIGGIIYAAIIVERILTACPNLENFCIEICEEAVLDDKYDLPPLAFKNYKM
jgi:hypothetical protein